jgi:hypothetical protein
MKTITPSPHYSLRLPNDIREQYDDGVLSLWRDDAPTALQISSKLRESGEQVSAEERLADLIAKGGSWSPLKITCDADCETAAASTTDDTFVWWHVYLVCPYLAIYATVSFPTESEVDRWAVEAIQSIRFGDPIVVPV